MENRKVLVKIDVYYIDIYVEKKNVLYQGNGDVERSYMVQKICILQFRKSIRVLMLMICQFLRIQFK